VLEHNSLKGRFSGGIEFRGADLAGVQEIESWVWGKSGNTRGVWTVSGIDGNVDSWKTTF
jgi:hypothetical protein